MIPKVITSCLAIMPQINIAGDVTVNFGSDIAIVIAICWLIARTMR